MKETILKALTITFFLLPGLSRAEDLTTCNPVSKYSLTDEHIGSVTLKCPSGKFMGAVACSSELYKYSQEVTLLSSNSAKCDFELQVENPDSDFDDNGDLIAEPIVIDRARLQINCCTR